MALALGMWIESCFCFLYITRFWGAEEVSRKLIDDIVQNALLFNYLL